MVSKWVYSRDYLQNSQNVAAKKWEDIVQSCWYCSYGTVLDGDTMNHPALSYFPQAILYLEFRSPDDHYSTSAKLDTVGYLRVSHKLVQILLWATQLTEEFLQICSHPCRCRRQLTITICSLELNYHAKPENRHLFGKGIHNKSLPNYIARSIWANKNQKRRQMTPSTLAEK